MLRRFRITFATILIAVLSLFFLDFTEKVPLWIAYLAKIQFVPALLGTLQGIALSSVILVVLIGLTLLFGRVYCGFLCPLGIFQDLVGRLAGLFHRKRRYRPLSPRKKTRLLFLGVMVLSIILTTFGIAYLSFVTGLLDPYGIFGRIMTHIFTPIYYLGNNLITVVTRSSGGNYFYFLPITVKGGISVLVAFLSLLLVGFFAWRWGRLYCNSICPVGTFLGFLSKYSLFKIRIDAGKCVGCKLCEGGCKGGCLDVTNKRVDNDRCVVCFNCLSRCQKDAIHYSFSHPSPKKSLPVLSRQSTPGGGTSGDGTQGSEGTRVLNSGAGIPDRSDGIDRSKRRFLLGALASVTAVVSASPSGKAGRAIAETTLKISENGKVPYHIDHAISPPGSVSLKHLASHCSACHLCVDQCPTNVIHTAVFDYGLSGMMLPVMKFSTEVFCNFDCVRCGEVCPSGAIRPLTLEEKHKTQIGRVVFIKENCVVFTEETNCGACAEHCPTKAIYMVDYKDNLRIPETNEEICVGCGACESICPVIPFKAVHVEGNGVHQVAKDPPPTKKFEEKIDDFGF